MADPYNIDMITKFLKFNQVELPKEGVRPPPDLYVSTPTQSNQLPTSRAAYGMSFSPTTFVQLGVSNPQSNPISSIASSLPPFSSNIHMLTIPHSIPTISIPHVSIPQISIPQFNIHHIPQSIP